MTTRYLQSSTFRLALIYMALFGASVLLLLGFIYWSTAAYLTQQTDQTIEAEIEDLAERYRMARLAGLTTLISERLSRKPAGSAIYLLVDKDLDPLLGNLDRWPRGAPIRTAGWISGWKDPGRTTRTSTRHGCGCSASRAVYCCSSAATSTISSTPSSASYSRWPGDSRSRSYSVAWAAP
jgi:hypothetical protein